MRHRLSDEEKRDVYMPHDTQPKQISTMHSLGHQIILENLNSLNLTEDFKLIDSDPLKRLLFEDAAQIAGFDRAKGRKALKQKQRGIQLNKDDNLHKIIQQYNDILRACNSIITVAFG